MTIFLFFWKLFSTWLCEAQLRLTADIPNRRLIGCRLAPYWSIHPIRFLIGWNTCIHFILALWPILFLLGFFDPLVNILKTTTLCGNSPSCSFLLVLWPATPICPDPAFTEVQQYCVVVVRASIFDPFGQYFEIHDTFVLENLSTCSWGLPTPLTSFRAVKMFPNCLKTTSRF